MTETLTKEQEERYIKMFSDSIGGGRVNFNCVYEATFDPKKWMDYIASELALQRQTLEKEWDSREIMVRSQEQADADQRLLVQKHDLIQEFREILNGLDSGYCQPPKGSDTYGDGWLNVIEILKIELIALEKS